MKKIIIFALVLGAAIYAAVFCGCVNKNADIDVLIVEQNVRELDSEVDLNGLLLNREGIVCQTLDESDEVRAIVQTSGCGLYERYARSGFSTYAEFVGSDVAIELESILLEEQNRVKAEISAVCEAVFKYSYTSVFSGFVRLFDTQRGCRQYELGKPCRLYRGMGRRIQLR
ncbi:MAG: hypothetical protein PHX51_02635 [Clostridia bacterium]|nr:hypothetical protein [Clostridia bacterium]